MAASFYLLWANVSLIVFYLFYLVLFKRETFFVFNRIYLLSAVVLSLLIPLIDLSSIFRLPMIDIALADISIAAKGYISSVSDQKVNGFLLIYWAGTLFSGVMLVIKLGRVQKALKRPENGVAFSFWKTKVIDLTLSGVEVIDGHESIHVKQLHTIDVLLMNVVAVFFWFNPVIYLYKISIKFIHEYLADEHAAKLAGSKKQYAMILFCQNFKANAKLANTFFTPSELKARIAMLQKKRSAKSALWKYALCLPLIGMLMLCSSFGATDFSISNKLDRLASLPGGFPAFRSYLIHTAKKTNGKKRKVIVGFIVETDGSITGENIVEGLDQLSNDEAIRMIHQSPRWEPAIQNGKKIRSSYHIGINF
ncbi:M56 family metallopeptidase [Pedobacter psychrodurus]|uniref:M56 family metallopeptidase n=1 Tax=Pedobacter psychrodurus TaxID=2530456 RepID=UPI00292E13CF|nr:M56 family metallopeptidase [Pedobacter psychrodurus]